MTDFFKSRVETLELREDKKKIFISLQENQKKTQEKEKGSLRLQCRRVQRRINKARRPTRKYCILDGKCSHSTDKCKDLRAMVNKHKQKKKKLFPNIR